MDRLEAMSVLIAAVDAGSFSAASRKLGMPLPTISRKVSELEAHLKTRLLVRSTRKLSLTNAGVDYLAACKSILDLVNDAEAKASGEYNVPRGELIITAPLVFGRLHVLPVINDFLAGVPEIDVRLVLADRNINLVDDHVDMAVRIGALVDSGLIATRVGAVRRVVCGSPDYFAKHRIPKTLEDLSRHGSIAFTGLGSQTSWIFSGQGRGRTRSVSPRARLTVNTAEAAIDAAIAGVGVTRVLSYQVARAIKEGKLRIVLKDFEPDPLPVHLIHAAQGLMPLKMRSFLDFAAPRLRKTLGTG
jgi:DNA-binding transcriptional LysR family regulator